MKAKSLLRKTLREQRSLITTVQVANLSGRIIEKLLKELDWSFVKTTNLYLSNTQEKEIATWSLIQFIWRQYPKISIYVPKNEGFAKLNKDSSLHTNSFGIPEPESEEIKEPVNFDLIVLPVVGFDRRGYRLGYGGGYYDKFLAKHNCKQIVGLAYSFSEIDEIPDEPHDKKLQKIITEKEIILSKN